MRASARQQAVWRMYREIGPNFHQNLFSVHLLSGPLDVAALARAVTRLAKHQALLATVFHGDAPDVRIGEPPRLTVLDAAGRDATRMCQAEADHVFDLAGGEPAFRPVLVRIAEDRHALVLVVHLLIGDRRSMTVLLNDLVAAYLAETGGPELVPLATQYSELAAASPPTAAWDFWREHLTDLPTMAFRTRAVPAVGEYTDVHRYSGDWSPTLAAALQDHCRRARMTPFTAAATATAAVLAESLGLDDIRLTTMYLNRITGPELALVGPFSQGLMLRVRLGAEDTYRDLELQIRRGLLQGVAHRALPFDELIERLHERGMRRDEIAPVWFDVVETAPNDLPAFGAAETLPFPNLDESHQIPGTTLNLYLDQRPDAVRVTALANARLLSRGELSALVQAITHRLEFVTTEGAGQAKVLL